MKALSARELLELWEQGSRLYPLDQALLALRAALPEIPAEMIADWPLGRRNRALLELHAACLGHRLEAWAECAHCGEKLEIELDTRVLLEKYGEPARQGETVEGNGLVFRLPTSRDLAQAAREIDPAQGAVRLLQTCCRGQTPGAWTEEDLDSIGEKLAAADPLAEIRLSLACPLCAETHEETLDPAAFLWSELKTLAKRLLRDIHVLASAYGWSEHEILDLSEFRRSQYVEMVHA
jgi:hypothetical protein